MTRPWSPLAGVQPLAPRVHACTSAEIVRYLAASGDFNPIHFDREATGATGGRLLVPGRFKQACLGRLVSDWLGHRGFVRRLACRYLGADLVGQPLTCRGEVRRRSVDGGRRLVELRLSTHNAAGSPTTVGSAVVEWTAPGEGPWPWR